MHMTTYRITTAANVPMRKIRPRSLVSLWFLFLPFAGCLVLPSFGDAEDAPAKTMQKKEWVAEQIARLDADTLKERSAAEKELLEAGPEILPMLPPPELLPSASVKQAVRRVRVRLEEAQARESVKPARITLKETAPLENILKAVAERTGNAIDASALPPAMRERSVSLDVSNEPFWDVMEHLAKDAGFVIDGSAKGNINRSELVLEPDSKTAIKPSASTNVGAFRVEVDPLKLRTRFGKDDQQLLRVPFRLSAEPRLRPLFLKLAGKDFSARTKKGRSLDPFNPAQKLELPLGEGGTEATFHMDYQVQKPFQADAVELTGQATLTVAADSEDITFSDLAKSTGAARRRGGVTVTLNEVEFEPDKKHADRQSAVVRVTVHYDTGGPAFESHRTWIFHNRVFLEDAQGRRIERGQQYRTDLQTDGGVMVEYNFDNLPGGKDDYRFTYVAPTLIIDVPIRFEFKSLSVP